MVKDERQLKIAIPADQVPAGFTTHWEPKDGAWYYKGAAVDATETIITEFLKKDGQIYIAQQDWMDESLSPDTYIAKDQILASDFETTTLESINQGELAPKVIYGAAGTGKSEHLKHLAMKINAAQQASAACHITLSDLTLNGELVVIIKRHWNIEDGSWQASIVENLIVKHRLVLCLDGWDEIPDAKKRQLNKLWGIWNSKAPCFVTTRPAERTSLRIHSQRHQTVAITNAELKELLQKAFATSSQEAIAAEELDRAAEIYAQKTAEWLNTPERRELIQTPLHAHMLFAILLPQFSTWLPERANRTTIRSHGPWSNSQSFSLTKLYKQFIELQLNRWLNKLGFTEELLDLAPELRPQRLTQLAAHAFALQFGTATPTTAPEEILRKSEIINSHGTGFIHYTYQEFLAAWYIAYSLITMPTSAQRHAIETKLKQDFFSLKHRGMLRFLWNMLQQDDLIFFEQLNMATFLGAETLPAFANRLFTQLLNQDQLGYARSLWQPHLEEDREFNVSATHLAIFGDATHSFHQQSVTSLAATLNKRPTNLTAEAMSPLIWQLLRDQDHTLRNSQGILTAVIERIAPGIISYSGGGIYGDAQVRAMHNAMYAALLWIVNFPDQQIAEPLITKMRRIAQAGNTQRRNDAHCVWAVLAQNKTLLPYTTPGCLDRSRIETLLEILQDRETEITKQITKLYKQNQIAKWEPFSAAVLTQLYNRWRRMQEVGEGGVEETASNTAIRAALANIFTAPMHPDFEYVAFNWLQNLNALDRVNWPNYFDQVRTNSTEKKHALKIASNLGANFHHAAAFITATFNENPYYYAEDMLRILHQIGGLDRVPEAPYTHETAYLNILATYLSLCPTHKLFTTTPQITGSLHQIFHQLWIAIQTNAELKAIALPLLKKLVEITNSTFEYSSSTLRIRIRLLDTAAKPICSPETYPLSLLEEIIADLHRSDASAGAAAVDHDAGEGSATSAACEDADDGDGGDEMTLGRATLDALHKLTIFRHSDSGMQTGYIAELPSLA